MKGYKGMSNSMTCRDMQYEIGKTYSVDGEIKLCKNGLHFCKYLKDVAHYYPLDKSRYFEVEAGGKIVSGGDKSVAEMLTVVREVSRKEVNWALHSHGLYDKSFPMSFGNGYSFGYGCGYGDGFGDGFGCGYGNSYNDSDGYGCGYGSGYCRGCVDSVLNEVCIGM